MFAKDIIESHLQGTFLIECTTARMTESPVVRLAEEQTANGHLCLVVQNTGDSGICILSDWLRE